MIHSLMVRLFEEEERKGGSSIGKLGGIEELEYISDALNKMGLTDSVRIEYIDTVPREVGRTDDVDVIAGRWRGNWARRWSPAIKLPRTSAR